MCVEWLPYSSSMRPWSEYGTILFFIGLAPHFHWSAGTDLRRKIFFLQMVQLSGPGVTVFLFFAT